MPSESSSTITIPKETIINPSSDDGHKLGIYIPSIPVTHPIIPVKVVNKGDDMGVLMEEVVNKIVNKAVEKMNNDFVSYLDDINLEITTIKNEIKALQIDSSHQTERNIEVNTRLTKLENKEDNIIDVDTCIINKIKDILRKFIYDK